MSNTDVKKMISDIYQADIQSIRNLSKLANDLTKDGKLHVPGGLEVDGGVTIKGNLNAIKEGDTYLVNFKKNTSNKGRNGANYNTNSGVEVTFKNNKSGVAFYHDTRGPTELWSSLYVNNTSTFNGPTGFKNQKTGHMSHLNQPDGNIYLRGNVVIDGYGNSGKDLHVNGVTNLKNELIIYNGNNKGMTHFNHQNKGENYIRGNLRLDGHAGHHDYNGASGQGMHLIDLKVDGDSTVLIRNANGQAYHKDAWVCMMVGYWENFGGPHGGNDEWKYCFIGNKDHWHFKSHRTSWNNGFYSILCIPRTMFNRVDHNAREYR